MFSCTCKDRERLTDRPGSTLLAVDRVELAEVDEVKQEVSNVQRLDKLIRIKVPR